MHVADTWVMSVPMIQVTNVSPQASQQQMKELFSYLGDIEEIKIYPERYSDHLYKFVPVWYRTK